MATSEATQRNGFEWRNLLGPTYDWPIPTTEFSTSEATQRNGFEWRILLGPTYDWPIPTTEFSTSEATQRNGFEWRILLGPTHNWPIPTTTARQMTAIERCELCGESIGDDKPFVTNSAGQRPIHIACSGRNEPPANGRGPAGKNWQRLLRNFTSLKTLLRTPQRSIQ